DRPRRRPVLPQLLCLPRLDRGPPSSGLPASSAPSAPGFAASPVLAPASGRAARAPSSANRSVQAQAKARTNFVTVPSLSVNFPKHDVDRSEHGRYVGEHMAAAQEVHGLKMHEARRPDLATIGSVRSVGHEIDPELTLGRLDRCINLALGHVIAFGIQLEMMDQSFHRAFHYRALRRHHLVVLNGDRAELGGQPLATLLHDAYRLAHLLHAHEVAVVAVAVLTDRNVEFELGVALVRLRLAEIPGRA